MINKLNNYMIERIIGKGKSIMILGFIIYNGKINSRRLMYLRIKSEQYKESLLIGIILSNLMYQITGSFIYYTIIPIMYYLIKLAENLVSRLSNIEIPPMEMEALDNMNDPDYLEVRRGLGFLKYY
jgi:hypothetical protein